MWTAEDNQKYEELFLRYKNNTQTTINTDDVAILQKLINHYITTSDTASYDKIKALFDVFLDHFLVKLPPNMTLDSFERRSIYNYPLMLSMCEMLGTCPDRELMYNQFEQLKELISPCLDQAALGVKLYTHFYPQRPIGLVTDPGVNTSDPFANFSYEQRVDEIIRTALLKKVNDPNVNVNAIEKKKQEFIQTTKQVRRFYDLANLFKLYSQFNLVQGLERTGLVYFKSNCIDPGDFHLHPYATWIAMMPNNGFRTLFGLFFNQLTGGRRRIATELWGKFIVAENPKYEAWTMENKTCGGDPGFILVSPDRSRRLFIKQNENIFSEYFISKILTALGVKMPESGLLSDDHGSIMFYTLDLSRIYEKGDKKKQKQFEVIGNLPALKNLIYVLPLDEDDKQKAMTFMRETFGPQDSQEPHFKKARLSFAKIILAQTILGLIDVGSHSGNVGLVVTSSIEKKYNKFGIVDFSLSVNDISQSKNSLKKQVNNSLNKMMSIFKELHDYLSAEELETARKELLFPKVRSSSPEGFFLSHPQNERTDATSVVEKTYVSVINELKCLVKDERRFKEIENKLSTEKAIILKNLEYASNQVIITDHHQVSPSQ